MKNTLWLFLFIQGCSSQRELIVKYSEFVLVDSFYKPKGVIRPDLEFRMAEIPIFYFGKINDTIRTSPFCIIGYSGDSTRYDYEATSGNIDIIVDTIHTTSIRHYIFKRNSGYKQKKMDGSAYLIRVMNNGNKSILIGHGYNLCNTVRQVLNSEGKWTDIENDMYYGCGTGLAPTILKPNDILLAKMPKYKGSKLSKVRIKMTLNETNYYSNEFYEKLPNSLIIDSLQPISF